MSNELTDGLWYPASAFGGSREAGSSIRRDVSETARRHWQRCRAHLLRACWDLARPKTPFHACGRHQTRVRLTFQLYSSAARWAAGCRGGRCRCGSCWRRCSARPCRACGWGVWRKAGACCSRANQAARSTRSGASRFASMRPAASTISSTPRALASTPTRARWTWCLRTTPPGLTGR